MSRPRPSLHPSNDPRAHDIVATKAEEPQLSQRLRRLHHLADTLSGAVEMLQGRLSPVLTSAEEPSTKAETFQPSCPLDAELEEHELKLHGLSKDLDALIRRIAL